MQILKRLGLLLHETAAAMKREFERAARPHKLTLTQWRVLGHLHREGDARQTDLGQAINVSPMTISDVAERLELAGLLRREIDPDDSRAKRLVLTQAGTSVILKMQTVADGVFDKALAGIPASDVDTLTRALTRMTENLENR